MKKLVRGMLILGVCLNFTVTSAYAEGDALANKLLELFVKKGMINQQEADELLEAAKQDTQDTQDTMEAFNEEAPELPEGDFEFDFSSPDLVLGGGDDFGGEDESSGGLNFGGTFDSRFRAFGNGDIPGEVIHINELVLTTNIGEHISFLGEWLLQTNDFVNNVADDHGFAYAIFSNLPKLPKNSSIKLGRFRMKYGIDAVSDAPLNPLYTQIKKNIGFASDLGVEFEGYYDKLDLEYVLAVMNGPDNVRTQVMNADGSAGDFKRESKTNNSLPVIMHLSREFEKLNGMRFGVSYFDGRSWTFVNGLSLKQNAREPIGVNGGAVDGTTFVYKRRGSVDFSYQSELLRTNFAGEFTLGKDWITDTTATVRGYYLRADRPLISNKLDLQLQGDYWEDGRRATNDSYNIGAGLKYKMTDVAFIRGTYAYNNKYADDYVLQVYLPF